jgi:hypothetical protein
VSVDGIPATGLYGRWEPLATVIDLNVELEGENPYGGVKSGWIKLEAPLLPLFLTGNGEEYEEAEWEDVEEDEEESGEEDQWKDETEDEGEDKDDVAEGGVSSHPRQVYLRTQDGDLRGAFAYLT